MATRASRATSDSLAVEGPGMGSARSKRRGSLRWQKDWARENSGRPNIFAPRPAGSRTFSVGAAEVAWGVGAHAFLHEALFVCAGGRISLIWPLWFSMTKRELESPRA